MNSFCLYHAISQILREVKFKMFSPTFSIFSQQLFFLHFWKLKFLKTTASWKKGQNSGYRDWTDWVLSVYLRQLNQIFVQILTFKEKLLSDSWLDVSEKQMKKTLKDKILEIVPAKCDSWIICDVYIFDSWIVCDFVTYLIID